MPLRILSPFLLPKAQPFQMKLPNLTGSGMVFACEVGYTIATGSSVGMNVDITLDTSFVLPAVTDCTGNMATYDLTYTGDHLEGTCTLEAHEGVPEQIEPVIFERFSEDVDIDIPFCGDQNLCP